MKILNTHATTEGNMTDVRMYDAPSLQALLFIKIPMLYGITSKAEVMEVLKDLGEYTIESKDDGSYELFSLELHKESSFFGTDFAIMKVWEPIDGDVYERYNDIFIVMPDSYDTRASVALTNGKKLVAEAGDTDGYKEVCIFIEDENGTCFQDLAIVGEKYTYSNGNVKPIPGQYVTRVFADAYDEDYTHRFEVEEYKEHDERAMNIPDSVKL